MLPKQDNYKVGIYLRLSKDDERQGESLSIENQRRVLTNYVNEQGWSIYDEYVDDGISGVSFDEHTNGNKITCIANSILTPRALHLCNALFLFR